jgi:hypothetical protein
MEIGGKKAGEAPVGLLVPGQSETVVISHHFAKAGPQVVMAAIQASDDLASDNRSERVINVRGHLPVLLVDGNPSGTFFERAAGYPALALAPSSALIGGRPAGEGFLMDPRVVSVTALTPADLDDASVVVLADVSRLPGHLAGPLASKVAAGTGLIVIAGPRAEAEFYNSWTGTDGTLVPASLGSEAASADGISPAASTFEHEALDLFKKGGDLETALIKRWRKTNALTAGAIQAAAFSNGDVMLASRSYGNGRVMLATCAFDARSGNLPARRAFVPLVHELVTWTAGTGVELNVLASWSPRIALPRSQGGLSGTYYNHRKKNPKALLQRIDPSIDFSWEDRGPAPKMPRDNFAVSWQGSLIPSLTGRHVFEAEVDDRIEVRIGDHPVMKLSGGGWLGELDLDAGSPLPISVRYEEDEGNATARLFWIPPGGQKQIIPPSAFVPSTDPQSESLEAIDPLGLPRQATLRQSASGRDLSISGPAVPGIYQVSTGGAAVPDFDLLSDGKLPMAVLRDPSESLFESMKEDDLALIRKHIDLLLPASVADMLGILQGKGFGREIWKWLAIPALLLLILESMLARWVSKSRRAGEVVKVDFGETTVWRGGVK